MSLVILVPSESFAQDPSARAKLPLELHTPCLPELPDRSSVYRGVGKTILRGVSDRANADEPGRDGTRNPASRSFVFRRDSDTLVRCAGK